MDEEIKNSVMIITKWGTVLCVSEAGYFFHVAFDELYKNNNIPAVFVQRGSSFTLDGKDEQFQIFADPSGENVSFLRLMDVFLTCYESGSASFDASPPDTWEAMCVIKQEEFDSLSYIMKHSWVSSDQEKPQPITENKILHDFRVQVGSVVFSLMATFGSQRINADCCQTKAPFTEVTVWGEGWKLIMLRLYNPLIYFCAFGEKNYSLFEVAVNALTKYGEYTGDVLLITDPSSPCLYNINLSSQVNILTWEISYMTRFDFYCARYRLPRWKDAECYQPIIYMDTDIICDLPIQPLLYTLIWQDKIACQLEYFCQRDESEAVGAKLIEQDARAQNERSKEYGFNSGLLAFSSVKRCGDTLNLTLEVCSRYAKESKHRWTPACIDQPIANYIACLTGGYEDTNLCITKRTRLFYKGAIYDYKDYELASEVKDRHGFLHCWGSNNKLLLMNWYINEIDKLSDLSE